MPIAISTAFRANRVQVFDEIDPNDSASSPEQALAQVFTLVRGMNETLHAPTGGFRESELGDNVIDRLEAWLRRLFDKLTEIVAGLANGTSFSITVGSDVTVTVNLPPVGA